MHKKTLFLAVTLFLFIRGAYAQSLNDYRSIASGNWTNISVWEVYNGTTWVAATTYPGQVTGTNDVSIEGGDSISISSNIPNNINSLTIGDGAGATDTLLVSGNSSLNTLLVTIANGGYASWTSNVTFSLPAGAAFIIESGGSLDESRPCSAAKRLIIGSIIYATCNGGAGADYSFSDLNNQGGSLSVSPTSNAPICTGTTLTLFANPSGTGSDSATFSWNGTGPGSYSFSSSIENPTDTGLTSGTYTYTVTATNGSSSNTNSVMVIVNSLPNTPTSGGNETACNGATIPTLTVSVNTGETADWYNAASGGTLLLSNNINYTPATAGSYFAQARNTTSGCVSNGRIEIILTTVSCKVITNRKITYRVNN